MSNKLNLVSIFNLKGQNISDFILSLTDWLKIFKFKVFFRTVQFTFYLKITGKSSNDNLIHKLLNQSLQLKQSPTILLFENRSERKPSNVHMSTRLLPSNDTILQYLPNKRRKFTVVKCNILLKISCSYFISIFFLFKLSWSFFSFGVINYKLVCVCVQIGLTISFFLFLSLSLSLSFSLPHNHLGL